MVDAVRINQGWGIATAKYTKNQGMTHINAPAMPNKWRKWSPEIICELIMESIVDAQPLACKVRISRG